MRASCPHLLLALTGLLVTGVAHAAGAPGGLTGLERVAVRVESTADVATLSAELQQRIADALRQPPRGVHIDPASPDVLRLTVGIRSLSSATLRGFDLPFSGTYGVGPVRLALQRRVVVGGVSDVLATVWEDERQAAGPWRGVAAQARRLTDELVDAFLAAYRAIDPRRGERRRSPDLPQPVDRGGQDRKLRGRSPQANGPPLGFEPDRFVRQIVRDRKGAGRVDRRLDNHERWSHRLDAFERRWQCEVSRRRAEPDES